MIEKLLLAVDGSPNAFRAAQFAVKLLKSMPSARCTIISVVPFTKEEADYLGATGEYDAALSAGIKPLLEETEKIFAREEINVEKVVLQGDVASAIAGYAHENAFDLIVMGSRGLGGIKGVLLGSVSYRVMQVAHCPVTVVK